MEAEPDAMKEIFLCYREELVRQRRELDALIRTADAIDPAALDSCGDLIRMLREAAEALPLPAADLRPRFRHLDDPEDIRAELRRNQSIIQNKRQKEDLRIGVHSAVSTRAMFTKGNPRSLELGNEQKMAVMQMLRDSRE